MLRVISGKGMEHSIHSKC